jgi:integrase
LAKAGVPVNVIKELAGHKSIETTLRYMHTDRDAKRGAIDALTGQVPVTKYVSRESESSDT